MKKDLSRMNKLSLIGKFVLTVVTTLVVLQLIIQKPSSAQQPARDRLGVGDIVMSPLNLQQFRAQHGGGTAWVLCDGGRFPNSRYAQIVGRPDVPDLRGRYPRGFASGLPDPGGTMEDATRNHRHQFGDAAGLGADRWNIMRDAEGGGDNFVARIGVGSGGISTTGMVDGQPDNETRPKTTIVNFYIRIN